MSEFQIRMLHKWLLSLMERGLSYTEKYQQICIAILNLTTGVLHDDYTK